MPISRSSQSRASRARSRGAISADEMAKSANRTSFISSGELYAQSGAVGPLTPKEAGASTWHAAHALTGFNDGDPVQTMSSIISTTGDLTQSVAGQRPLYRRLGYNGRPYLEFDGTDDRLDGSVVTASLYADPFVIMIVAAQRTQPSATENWWCGNFNPKNIQIDTSRRLSTAGYAVVATNGLVLTLGVPVLVTVQGFGTRASSVGTGVIRINGEIEGKFNQDFGMDLSIQNLGAQINPDTNFAHINLYECCFFAKNLLSQAKVAAVEQYLLQTYGI
jgi:hypothetical protein